jgi:hypothetical protein
MRNSLIVAGIALATLSASVAPSKAESAAQAYPYCAFRAGSTSCYHLTLESCGKSCIRNPAYVGDTRARAILAGARVAPEASRANARTNGGRNTLTLKMMIGAINSDARASVAHGDDFEGWPTGYLVNRFGDHQAQGRF